MAKREYDVTEAIRVIKGTGNMVSDKKIYLRSKQLQSGEPGATSLGIRGWGAVDFLRKSGYSVVYEMSQTKEQADNSFGAA